MKAIDRATAERLATSRLSAGRLEHSRRVAGEATELACRYGASPVQAEIAGLLHDYCREVSAEEIVAAARRYGIEVGPVEARRPVGLLHGPVAAAELAGRGLGAEEAHAIARHTTGCAGMTVLDKCLYLADFCEPGRDFAGIERVRQLAAVSLDDAVGVAAQASLLDLIGRRRGVARSALDLYNETHASN
jgi:predicted HD superfamily hydrolase involved in NAD metabolism